MDLSELYRDVEESSPDGIWVFDLEGRTLYASPEIAHIHRISQDSLGALSVFDVLDDAGREQFVAHLDDVRAGRVNPVEVEVQWVRGHGDIVWMLVQESALLDDEGRPRALLHRYIDNSSVDAQRLAETLDRWLTPRTSYAGRLDLERLAELRELDDPDDGVSYLDRAIGNFLGGIDEQVAAMRLAADTGDTDQLRSVAHRVAGSALNLGATTLGEGLQKVEEHVLDGVPDQAAALLGELIDRLPADLDALRAYRREQFPARAG